MDNKEIWKNLKEGKEVLLNNEEINNFVEYVFSLNESEINIFVKQFASLYDKGLAYGILSRCYRCKLGSYVTQ